jgi:putative DNA primase/helicase
MSDSPTGDLPITAATSARTQIMQFQGALTTGLVTDRAGRTRPRSALDHAPLLVSPRDATPLGLASLYLQRRASDEQGKPVIARWAGEWWKMVDGFYRSFDDERLRSTLWAFLEKVTVVVRDDDGTRHEPLVPRKAMVAEVTEALMAEGYAPSVFDTPPVWISGRKDLDPEELLVCPNGILHMPSRRFLPPDPDLFTPYGINVPYVADAPVPTAWHQFLKDLWEEDPDCIEALQTMMGYFLTPDTSQQKLFLLVGPKRSGKGTLGRIIRAIMGARNVANPTLGSLERPFGMQSMIGKSLAIIGDARLSGRADQGAIVERLLSISGEDAIDVDRKHRDPVTLRLRTRILMLSNELPKLSDASGALASRFHLVTTTRSFLGDEDLGLEARLMAELPGILKWAIDGWHLLRERGSFWQPASSAESIAELQALASPVSQFIEECCELDELREIEATRLFERWQSWCKENGRDHAGTTQTFGRDLRAVLPRVQRHQRRLPGGGRMRLYRGIGLS